VQLSIGQGLLSASPLQLAVGYSAIGNRGFVLKPEIIKAIYEPGVPDALEPGFADISQARLAVEPNVNGDVIRQIPMPQGIYQPISEGLRRVIQGPGTVTERNGYRSTTGEKLFYFYPDNAIPVAGNYPWNDSSAFAAYSRDPARPYTVSAYLEKSGYGSQGAGPVVKCMFLQLSGIAQTDPVVLSDPLDTDSTVAAPPKQLADTSCYDGRFSNVQSTE